MTRQDTPPQPMLAPSRPPGETVEEQVKSTWRVLADHLNGMAGQAMRAAVTRNTNATAALIEPIRELTIAVRELTMRLGLSREDMAARAEPNEFKPGDLSGPGERKP